MCFDSMDSKYSTLAVNEMGSILDFHIVLVKSSYGRMGIPQNSFKELWKNYLSNFSKFTDCSVPFFSINNSILMGWNHDIFSQLNSFPENKTRKSNFRISYNSSSNIADWWTQTQILCLKKAPIQNI